MPEAYKFKVMGVCGKGASPHIRAIEPGDVVGKPKPTSVVARSLLCVCQVVVVGRTGGPKNKVLRAIVTRLRRASWQCKSGIAFGNGKR